MKKEVIPDGSKVIVFRRCNDYVCIRRPILSCNVGTIISSELTEFQLHGTPWMERMYKIVGDDGHMFYERYNDYSSSSFSFATKKDYDKYLKSCIEYNLQEIRKIEEINSEILEYLEKLKTTLK